MTSSTGRVAANPAPLFTVPPIVTDVAQLLPSAAPRPSPAGAMDGGVSGSMVPTPLPQCSGGPSLPTTRGLSSSYAGVGDSDLAAFDAMLAGSTPLAMSLPSFAAAAAAAAAPVVRGDGAGSDDGLKLAGNAESGFEGGLSMSGPGQAMELVVNTPASGSTASATTALSLQQLEPMEAER